MLGTRPTLWCLGVGGNPWGTASTLNQSAGAVGKQQCNSCAGWGADIFAVSDTVSPHLSVQCVEKAPCDKLWPGKPLQLLSHLWYTTKIRGVPPVMPPVAVWQFKITLRVMVEGQFWTPWSELPEKTSNLRVLQRISQGVTSRFGRELRNSGQKSWESLR